MHERGGQPAGLPAARKKVNVQGSTQLGSRCAGRQGTGRQVRTSARMLS